MQQRSMPESVERSNSPEVVRSAIIEIGPGFDPKKTVPALSRTAREHIARGAPYYAVDHSTHALGQVREGAVIKATLAEFADNEFLERSAASINVFNVFGEPWSKRSRDPFLEQIFRKFYRMLIKDGHVVISETYTPRDAQHILALLFGEYGFTAKIYRGAEACEQGLKKLGFVEDALKRLDYDSRKVEKYGEPFVIILTKKQK